MCIYERVYLCACVSVFVCVRALVCVYICAYVCSDVAKGGCWVVHPHYCENCQFFFVLVGKFVGKFEEKIIKTS